MTDLSVEIAGVAFPNPVIVGSCSLTRDLSTIETLVEAGAGGVITKTISPDPLPGPPHHFRAAWADRSMAVSADARLTTDEGVELVAGARKAVDVPIIANVIGRSDNVDVWADTCLRLQAAGAHMVELDLNCHPEHGLDLDIPQTLGFYDTFSIGQDPAVTGNLVASLRRRLSIPVISKMTLRAPDIIAVARASADAGAGCVSGVNAFNGLPSLDVDRASTSMPGFDEFMIGPICGPELTHLGRRWTALISKAIDAPYISGSGILTGRHVVERLLLGAHATAICTALYLEGPAVLSEMTTYLADFMQRHGHTSVSDFRGVALQKLVERGAAERKPIVPRIIDPEKWQSHGPAVYELSRLVCTCIHRVNGSVEFNEADCTGCAIPLMHAPAGTLEMTAP